MMTRSSADSISLNERRDSDRDGLGAGFSIGCSMRETADCLDEVARDLEAVVSDRTGPDLEVIRRDIAAQTCRIAVIGQVKAGKSSLINALIQRPKFMPADVNPWTSVVTSLHFGRRDDDTPAAIFQFFDEQDWRHLSSGGRLQELTDRLGVPVEEEALAGQVRDMRQQAESRLGRQFYHLLGKQHRFLTVSSEVLARYACAGELGSTANGPARPAAGRFADITKSAALFLDDGPFAFPTTIIDTPGANDPFLVRGELSRNELEQADAYVVVLTAQQALSSADLGLLRLLHGLHKERMIVFINRIDQLGDIEADSASLVEHTRSKLAEEFPDADVPVIIGSARWGEIGLDADGLADSSASLDACLAHARRQGVLREEGTIYPEEIRAALMTCSGLLELSSVVDRVIMRGPAMLGLKRAAGGLKALLDSAQRSAQSEIAVLNDFLPNAKVVASAQERRDEEGNIVHAEALLGELKEISDTIARDLTLIRNIGVQNLRNALNEAIDVFLEQQGALLRRQLRRFRRQRVWRCETSELRSRMEEVFLEIYRGIADRMTEAEQTAHDEMRQCYRRAVADDMPAMTSEGCYVIDPSPSIGALGRTMALDLDEAWARWWRRWRGHEDRVRQLETVILREFKPVAAALIDSADAELSMHITVTSQRLAGIRRDMAASLERREELLTRAMAVIRENPNAFAAREHIERAERDLETQQSVLGGAEALKARLASALPG